MDKIHVDENKESENNSEEELEEFLIKDHMGENILYDSAITDLKELEREMIKLGSYFIDKYERMAREEPSKDQGFLLDLQVLYHSNSDYIEACLLIDRATVLHDLYVLEAQYQHSKVKK